MHVVPEALSLVSRVPITGVFRALESSLANHLIRLEQEAWGDDQAERLGGLEIDDQLELHGLLDREVAWFGTFEDAILVVSSMSIHFNVVHGIAHERFSEKRAPYSTYLRP